MAGEVAGGAIGRQFRVGLRGFRPCGGSSVCQVHAGRQGEGLSEQVAKDTKKGDVWVVLHGRVLGVCWEKRMI